MNIVFIGDVVGRSGREALKKHITTIKEKYSPDAVIVNGENAAHGFGITESICKEFYDIGVDCITTGNHIWSQREVIVYIGRDKKLIRPLNYPDDSPGKGYYELDVFGGKLLVINLMGREFMYSVDCPFRKIDNFLKNYRLGGNVKGIFIDFHAEVTSEKMAMAHFLDGRVSAVVGTHTHVPTADAHILPKGTAFQSDAGMTGDYNGVIGYTPEAPIFKFLRRMPGERFTPASGEGTVCGTYIKIDDISGKAIKISPVRIGGILSQS